MKNPPSSTSVFNKMQRENKKPLEKREKTTPPKTQTQTQNKKEKNKNPKNQPHLPPNPIQTSNYFVSHSSLPLHLKWRTRIYIVTCSWKYKSSCQLITAWKQHWSGKNLNLYLRYCTLRCNWLSMCIDFWGVFSFCVCDFFETD